MISNAKEAISELLRLARRHEFRVVPACAPLKRIVVDTDEPIANGLTIANIEIQTDCPVVGVLPVTIDYIPLTGELEFLITNRTYVVSVLVPKGTRRIVIRNATNVPVLAGCRVRKLWYSRFEDIGSLASSGLVKMITGAKKCIFLHTLGKTGSSSLHESLYSLPGVVCIRDHFVNLPNMSGDQNEPESTTLHAMTLPSFISARIAMFALHYGFSHPDSVDVICGVRRFDSQLLAAIFQSQGQNYLDLGWSAEDVLESIYRGDPRMHTWQYWWEKEFFSTHGFSIGELKRGMQRVGFTWKYQAPSGISYRFYRIEDGDSALLECLLPYSHYASDPDRFPGAIKHFNIGAEKNYSELYKEVVSKADLARLQDRRTTLIRQIDELFYGP